MLNKKGFTLVEMLVAMVVLLLVSLALMQTALIGIDANMVNVLRDEAISIAETEMNDARNISFDSLTGSSSKTVPRYFRNISNFSYSVTRTITDLNTDNKQATITVTWAWKEKTVANGNPYTHTISTILRRQ